MLFQHILIKRNLCLIQPHRLTSVMNIYNMKLNICGWKFNSRCYTIPTNLIKINYERV